MGLCRGLLHVERNRLYPLVPAGGGPGGEGDSAAHRKGAWRQALAGRAGMAAAALSPDAADSRNFLTRTSGGKHAGRVAAAKRARIQGSGGSSRADVLQIEQSGQGFTQIFTDLRELSKWIRANPWPQIFLTSVEERFADTA